MVEKSLRQVDLQKLIQRRFHPSPSAWEDQVLYFLMLDRFSDGNENSFRDNQGRISAGGSTPPFQPSDEGNAVQTASQASDWREAGVRWQGGSLKGLKSKIGYLKRMGVTAIWISPVFKQVAFQETYHGYGIQNFLEIDPHFGTRQDLRDLVRAAHRNGIYIILDIILNHTGNVFGYDANRHWTQDQASGTWYLDTRWDGGTYEVNGFRDPHGEPVYPFGKVDLSQHPQAWPDGAVWPVEFQEPAAFTARGQISNWDYDPEFREGDFYDLKDVNLGDGTLDDYRPSSALKALCQVYQYWIAYADLDGFRIDTVKHMDLGAVRFFASVIHEFAQRIGKENFYLIGEITGGRQRAFQTLEQTGLNAALGIDDIPDKLEYMVKGYRNPTDYFDLFRNSILVHKESHIWFRNHVVTLFDDHDQVRKGGQKARFSAGDPRWRKLLLNVLAVNATTMGIPCVYYGTEQGFDGQGDSDRYLRESMFGGEFGAFRSKDKHFFNEEHPVYQELAKILAVRRQEIALRRGRQYLSKISGDGSHFGVPQMIGGEIRSIVAWSRLFDDTEILLAINTDPDRPRTAWVRLKTENHTPEKLMKCLYSSTPAETSQELSLEQADGKYLVKLTVPAAGFVIYK